MGVVLARQVCTKVLEKCEKTQGDLDAVWKDEEFVALATDGVIALWQNKAVSSLFHQQFAETSAYIVAHSSPISTKDDYHQS